MNHGESDNLACAHMTCMTPCASGASTIPAPPWDDAARALPRAPARGRPRPHAARVHVQRDCVAPFASHEEDLARGPVRGPAAEAGVQEHLGVEVQDDDPHERRAPGSIAHGNDHGQADTTVVLVRVVILEDDPPPTAQPRWHVAQ